MTPDNLRATVIADFSMSPGLLEEPNVRDILSGRMATAVSAGRAIGPGRAVEATRQALESLPCIENATHVLFSICGGEGFTLDEVNEAFGAVEEAAHTEANITFASFIDSDLTDEFQVTMIAGNL